jgi:hypothetical protein
MTAYWQRANARLSAAAPSRPLGEHGSDFDHRGEYGRFPGDTVSRRRLFGSRVRRRVLEWRTGRLGAAMSIWQSPIMSLPRLTFAPLLCVRFAVFYSHPFAEPV